ncbi:MAG TPA: phosphoribosylanthranilate isomerase [Gammaproteobacteria bacterium]|nr:phosphoribosylanthranilate isomerase [Gammaproteobacteria bacterium]
MAVRVKICGITRPKDAQIAVAAGADAIGLVFYPGSRRYVNIELASEIVEGLCPLVLLVGLFVDQSPAEIEQVCQAVPLNLLQFHGKESVTDCERYSLPYIKAIGVARGVDMVGIASTYTSARAILLDKFDTEAHGGTGQSFDWSQSPCLTLPVILAGGLTAENVESGIKTVKPSAVDVSSGVESAPGIKDAEKVKRFIEVAKSVV